MGPDRDQLRDEILEEAMSLPPGDRRVFVKRICMSDEELEAEVLRLLELHDDMQSGFLECPPASEVTEPLADGSRLERYQIESVIGRGGMAIVYRAKDTIAARLVALKLISTSFLDQREVQRRFLIELGTMQRVHHENIVSVYDSGEHEGQPFIVMELLNGEDLGRAIKSGNCGGIAARVKIARQIAAALSHVHAAGILHRDVKPSNVFLEDSGLVKLMDFGVSRLLEPGVSHGSTFAGTLQYMAPERVSGAPATRATDIYSFGVLLYELFAGSTAAASMAALLEEGIGGSISVEALESAGLPSAIIQIIIDATSKDPAARPSSCAKLETQLAVVSAGSAR